MLHTADGLVRGKRQHCAQIAEQLFDQFDRIARGHRRFELEYGVQCAQSVAQERPNCGTCIGVHVQPIASVCGQHGVVQMQVEVVVAKVADRLERQHVASRAEDVLFLAARHKQRLAAGDDVLKDVEHLDGVAEQQLDGGREAAGTLVGWDMG